MGQSSAIVYSVTLEPTCSTEEHSKHTTHVHVLLNIETTCSNEHVRFRMFVAILWP